MKRFLKAAFLIVSLALLTACAREPAPSRVFVLGLDGLDPRVVDLLISEGQLPNFAKLRQEGASGRLLAEKPLLSPILWTTIATGKRPAEHGIGHFIAVDTVTGDEVPAMSAMRRVEALWTIASRNDLEVASVGWWATWPPEKVRGAIVSDHVAYHFLFEEGLTENALPGDDRTHPPKLAERIAPLLRRPQDLRAEELASFVDVPPEELARPFDFDDDLAHFRWALATAKSYRDIALTLWREDEPTLALLYIEGTDSASHLFGHLFRAEGLAGELAEQQRRYGRTVEEMYRFADRILGDVLAAIDDRTTLVVLSDHGFELGALHDDPSKTRDLRRVSERFHRPEGILYLYGRQIRQARLEGATQLDVTPTVLALLGLPAARDMPGRVLAEAFDPGTSARDLLDRRIPSYEEGIGGDRGAARADGDDTVVRAQREHLESLGYLGAEGDDDTVAEAASSPQGERNLAAILFSEGRFEEAARRYRHLVETAPEEAALRTSLAGALGALGRYDEAMVELDRALELEPLNVEAYHNRAVIRERRGETAAAVADYETALRYQPGYEPSRRALRRLTGRDEARAPRDENEARAAELAETASVATRRGDYAEAMRLLDEAEKVAPEYVVVYQYRANVAYLMGDRDAAVAALEKAIELEPGNALFQANLERLRSGGN